MPKTPLDWWSQAEIAWPGFLREGSLKALEQRLAFMADKQFDAGVFKERQETLRKVTLPENGHLGTHPVVLEFCQVHEMLMAVYDSLHSYGLSHGMRSGSTPSRSTASAMFINVTALRGMPVFLYRSSVSASISPG